MFRIGGNRLDKKSFLKLIDERKEVLYKTAYIYVKNQQDAVDIVDETIYKAYSSINKIREEKYFNTYITRILINSSIDFIRKNKKIVYVEEIAAEDRTKELKEEKMDLFTAIDKLPAMEKTIIILKYFQDLKIKEISEVLNQSESNVKNYLHKALTNLRCDLKEEYCNE